MTAGAIAARSPWLVVFGGLPGVGKSAIAQRLVAQCGAVYLRIDTIEQALRDSGMLAGDVGAAGYLAAYALARSNLHHGLTVVADFVNPLPVTRQAWRDVAADAGSRVLEIEVICSDQDLHRQRVETRQSEVPGLRLPEWASVLAHDYAAWTQPHLVLDSAMLSPEQAVAAITAHLAR
ncbi:AAA family ATPase [Xanthomonas campestris]|uniref:AAA family ATPase n=1 Tax=Xanthomonas campestris TaxID=339 RepID=UPI00164BACFF|nr:AAA family ATPase [Xanthomonas campestris]